jgi:DHA1 family multidrug resistance protein-like MFS transporter
MTFVALILQMVFLDETYAPALLTSNANKLRLETKNMSFYATHELEAVTFNSLLDRNINRPLRLLFGEIILFLVCLYMAFV